MENQPSIDTMFTPHLIPDPFDVFVLEDEQSEEALLVRAEEVAHRGQRAASSGQRRADGGSGSQNGRGRNWRRNKKAEGRSGWEEVTKQQEA